MGASIWAKVIWCGFIHFYKDHCGCFPGMFSLSTLSLIHKKALGQVKSSNYNWLSKVKNSRPREVGEIWCLKFSRTTEGITGHGHHCCLFQWPDIWDIKELSLWHLRIASPEWGGWAGGAFFSGKFIINLKSTFLQSFYLKVSWRIIKSWWENKAVWL